MVRTPSLFLSLAVVLDQGISYYLSLEWLNGKNIKVNPIITLLLVNYSGLL